MKRLLVGVLLGALIFAGAVGAHVVNITNPLSADLDGGNYSISDLNMLATNGPLTVGNGVLYLDTNHNRPSVRWGTESPITDPRAVDAQPGSLFLEYAYQQESAWIKTGPFATDWRQLAFVP